MNPPQVARLYVTHNAPQKVAVQIPDTPYELHLHPAAPVAPSPQGRVHGVIRCSVWKLDVVSAGGAYVEPLIGRPRRVQGKVIGSLPESNSLIVEVRGTPIVGDLPPRYHVAD
jgi:hypothetical protein